MTDELAFGLLGEDHYHGTPLNPRAPATVQLLEEAFSVADPDVRQVLEEPVERPEEIFDGRMRRTTIGEIDGGTATSERAVGTGFEAWLDTYGVVQTHSRTRRARRRHEDNLRENTNTRAGR